ncbi:MAG: hypothetical protein CSA84_00050 [Actinomycetales bacterium]|nr:MAG: hypothetical protein CSA84_00050 [Actinomycetales bacterium]
MNLGLRGKGVLVTGGSGGIGRAIVAAFAAEGARVRFTYSTNTDGAQQLADEEGLATPIEMQLGSAESVSAAYAVAERDGPIDVLVNNAVQWRPDPNDHATPTYFATNIDGPLRLTSLAARRMAERKWGRITTISSNIAEDGMAGSVLYSTAKAALHGMAASLQWDVGSSGVLINTVLPGLTLTDRARSVLPDEIREQERRATPTGVLSTPQGIANLVVFLCSAANVNITGETIRVTGGR